MSEKVGRLVVEQAMEQHLEGQDAFGRISRKAAAKALSVSDGTLANWATEGIGPKPYRQRGKVFYLVEDVRAFALAPARAA